MTGTNVYRLCSEHADEKTNQLCDELYSMINPWISNALDEYRNTKLFRAFQAVGGTATKHPFFVFGYQGATGVILQVQIVNILGDELTIEGSVAKNVIHFIPVSDRVIKALRKNKARIIYRTNKYIVKDLKEWTGFRVNERANLISKFISKI